jgi:hypothetical protein
MCDSCKWRLSLRDIQKIWASGKVRSPFLSSVARFILKHHHVSRRQRIAIHLIRLEQTTKLHPRNRTG